MAFSKTSADAVCHQDVLSFIFDNSNHSLSAKQVAESPVLSDDLETSGHSITTAKRTIQRAITAFQKSDTRRGDTVCLVCPNNRDALILYLAVIGLGAIVSTAPMNDVYDFAKHFHTIQARLVLTTKRFKKTAAHALERAKLPKVKVMEMDDFMSEVNKSKRSDWYRFDDAKTAHTTTACLLATTSLDDGSPKFAARSHYSLVMEALRLQDTPSQPEQKRLVCTHFNDPFTIPLVIINPLRLGLCTILMDDFAPHWFMQVINEERVTDVVLSCDMLCEIVSCYMQFPGRADLLCTVWQGGAAPDANLHVKRFVDMCHEQSVKFHSVWSSAETGWIAVYDYTRDGDKMVVNSSAVAENYSVCADGAIGSPTGTGTGRGLLCIDGVGKMQSYYNHKDQAPRVPKGTAAVVGYDVTDSPGGRCHILGLSDDLIMVNGIMVHPSAFELRLMAYPDILDAGVISLGPHGASSVTDLIRAYVILHYDARLTATEIKKWLLHDPANTGVEDCQIRFVEDIPRNDSGALLRSGLRSLARGDIAREVLARRGHCDWPDIQLKDCQLQREGPNRAK